MARNPLKILSASTIFLTSRWSALFLSFCFSILYSRLLGLENRSVLTFILTIVSLLVLGITSSLGLRLRHKISLQRDKKLLINRYLSDLIHLTLILVIIFLVIIVPYSLLVITINFKILILAIILLITSNLVYGFSEILIGLDRINIVGLFGILEILFQFIAFYFVHIILGTSLIVAVLAGISLSYLISSVIFLKISQVYLSSPTLLTNLVHRRKMTELLTWESLAVTLPTVLMDRLDKILIGFLLPLPDLSKYSIVLVFFSALRSIPETIARIRFSRHAISFSLRKTKIPWGILVLIVFFFGIYPIYRILISSLLGPNWLVTFTTFLVVGIFEVTRGFFLLQINNDFASTKNSNKLPNILFLVSISFTLTILFSSFFGLVAVPASFGVAYFILILKQRLASKE